MSVDNINFNRNLIIGEFIKEGKFRFSGTVKVNNKIEDCYIASNCKLGQLINLNGEEVWLKSIKKKSKFKYMLYAVKKERSPILLELQAINVIIGDYLRRQRKFENLKGEISYEKTLGNGYRADLYISSQDIIIEGKTILSEDRVASYPNVKMERAIAQLQKIKLLLEEGHNVYYWFVSLNPLCNRLFLNEESNNFIELITVCRKLGMKIVFSTLKYDIEKGFYINRSHLL